MKNMRKILALVLAMVMVMAMSVTAFAAEGDPTITAPANNRSYAVYQIFTGDLANGKLSNVKWGANGTGTIGEAVSEETLTAVAAITGSDAEKAAAIAKYVKLDSTAFGTVTNGSSISVPTGYYLIKDNGPVADGEGYSLYVVEVVDSVTITPKTGTTTSEKKVKDDEGANTGWNDSADYDIGDAVPFQLKATVASDYDNYKNGYKLTFHDKESAGLTFNKESVKVYVDGNEITTGFTVTAPAADGDTFDVAFANLKDIAAVHAGSVITVEYTSTLNENAKIGAEGNPNASHITYTNNPNDTQAGENGKTPDDTVIVFTYKVVVTKYADSVADTKKLTGAEFTLTKDGKTIAVVKSDDGTQFTFKGLDAGTYTLTETVTPAGFNTIEPITIVITATHDVTNDEPKLLTLTVTPADSFTVEMTTDNKPTGTINGNVINKSGSTLPETGGMGTTIFYVLGAVMVLGAGVLLITKRRMNAR